jgi:predicted DNA-binding transcriptional regulator AlpA
MVFPLKNNYFSYCRMIKNHSTANPYGLTKQNNPKGLKENSMKTILINKKEVAALLGGMSESKVLRLMRNEKLPCIRLTQGTILFDQNEVKKWAETRPALQKTEKQQADANRRRAEAEARKQERQEAEERFIIAQYLELERLRERFSGRPQQEAITPIA